jgi:hypothetical protein
VRGNPVLELVRPFVAPFVIRLLLRAVILVMMWQENLL